MPRLRKTPLMDDAATTTAATGGPGRIPAITQEMVEALSDVLASVSGDSLEEWRDRFFPCTESLIYAKDHKERVEKLHAILRRKFVATP